MPDTTLPDEITEALLEIGAVRVDLDNPIRFRSGILSPIYCDNRLLLGHPGFRKTSRGVMITPMIGGSTTVTIAVSATATAAAVPPEA